MKNFPNLVGYVFIMIALLLQTRFNIMLFSNNSMTSGERKPVKVAHAYPLHVVSAVLSRPTGTQHSALLIFSHTVYNDGVDSSRPLKND